MQFKKGIPVSPGVAISTAVVVDAEDQPVPRRTVPADDVANQCKRLTEALDISHQELEEQRLQTLETLGTELARIFSFHQGLLRDEHLVNQFHDLINNEQVTAEFAVYSVMRDLAQEFHKLDSRLARERAADVWDLERRVLKHLIGSMRQDLEHLTHHALVVAFDLTPSQTASLDKKMIKALATDAGGRTSHTSILAHALGIPAIVGVEGLTASISTGDTVIIDGNEGLVIIDPDEDKLADYRKAMDRYNKAEHDLIELRDLPAVTADGVEITLLANIEFPSEIPAALGKGATGIGLYRTEFLYLGADHEPSEQEQYENYCEALTALDGKPMTIRTLDLGADKLTDSDITDHHERNPFLGCRSIRLCLQNLPLFKRQLHAILRASARGQIRLMFPLISSVMEVRQAKMIFNDVMEDLDENGIEHGKDIKVGIMIEVPSAALQANILAREVDFFSIGTNDLIQYTCAVDRGNERIANLYSGAHPAVVKLMRQVVNAANRAGIDVSCCGELAGEPEFVMLLLGLGLRIFSITPPAIPEVKKIIRSVSMKKCRQIAKSARRFDSDRGILNYLRNETRKIVPEVYDGRSIGG